MRLRSGTACLLGLLALVVPAAARGQQASDTVPYALQYHAARRAAFAKEPVVPGRIIFLGNSITEFGDWAALLKDPTVLNRGIAGDITFGMLRRLDEVVQRRPAKLFLEAGINDISLNVAPATIASRITAIVTGVRRHSPQTVVYVTSVLPTNDAARTEHPSLYGKNDRVEAVNALLQANAARDRYFFVDLHREVRDARGQLDRRYADADGLHLNAEGYRVWVALLRRRGFLPGPA